jgi:hypothetical protein
MLLAIVCIPLMPMRYNTFLFPLLLNAVCMFYEVIFTACAAFLPSLNDTTGSLSFSAIAFTCSVSLTFCGD